MDNNLSSIGQPIRPQKIGTYLIEKTIGKGNFSVVKLAKHTITELKVAIKIIDKTRLSAENLQKVQREVVILKSIHHPNIIKLYQVMETAKLLCIVTEYLPNGELFEYIAKNGRLCEKVARYKFMEILSAVEHCHKNNIVHRDLKAENMLLDQSNTIKLADFGFGTFQPEGLNSLLTTWCGSPPYAAPEIFKGEPYTGTKADIWSLGVLLYVIVVGFLPFGASELPKLRDQVLTGTFRVPFWLSCSCEELLRAMLAKSPDRRPNIKQLYHFKWLSEVAHSNLQSEPYSVSPASSAIKSSSNSSTSQPNPPKPNLAAEMEVGIYDELVIQVMERNGMNRNLILESLGRCAYDHLTATYLLLGERLQRTRSSLSHTLTSHLKSLDSTIGRTSFDRNVDVPSNEDIFQSPPSSNIDDFSYRQSYIPSSHLIVKNSDLARLNAIFPPKCVELKRHPNCISSLPHSDNIIDRPGFEFPRLPAHFLNNPSQYNEIKCPTIDENPLASLPVSIINVDTVQEVCQVESGELFSSGSHSPINLSCRKSPSVPSSSISGFPNDNSCFEKWFPPRTDVTVNSNRFCWPSSSNATTFAFLQSPQNVPRHLDVGNPVVSEDRKSTKTRRITTEVIDRHNPNYEEVAQRLISYLYSLSIPLQDTRNVQPIIGDSNPPTEDQTSGMGSSFDFDSPSNSLRQSPHNVRNTFYEEAGVDLSNGIQNQTDYSSQDVEQFPLLLSMSAPIGQTVFQEGFQRNPPTVPVFPPRMFRRKIGVVSRPNALQEHIQQFRLRMNMEE